APSWPGLPVARLAPGLRPAAAAGRARNGDRERHLPRDARGRLRELDLDLRSDIAAAGAAGAAARPEDVVAEEGAEQVGQAAEVDGRRREAAALQPVVAVAVVELARLALREHL